MGKILSLDELQKMFDETAEGSMERRCAIADCMGISLAHAIEESELRSEQIDHGNEDKRIATTSYTLEVLPGTFAICRLNADAEVPDWATGEISSITRTSDELSVVCSQDNVPEDIHCEPDWRCLRVVGKLDFSMVGVIASLTGTLAEVRISVFVVSTYNTDYLLVKDADLEATAESLRSAGHVVS